jgi:hypothetical protein
MDKQDLRIIIALVALLITVMFGIAALLLAALAL